MLNGIALPQHMKDLEIREVVVRRKHLEGSMLLDVPRKHLEGSMLKGIENV